jgi:hypothetical protein
MTTWKQRKKFQILIFPCSPKEATDLGMSVVLLGNGNLGREFTNALLQRLHIAAPKRINAQRKEKNKKINKLASPALYAWHLPIRNLLLLPLMILLNFLLPLDHF